MTSTQGWLCTMCQPNIPSHAVFSRALSSNDPPITLQSAPHERDKAQWGSSLYHGGCRHGGPGSRNRRNSRPLPVNVLGFAKARLRTVQQILKNTSRTIPLPQRRFIPSTKGTFFPTRLNHHSATLAVPQIFHALY